MKRTEMERIEREYKRSQKKELFQQRTGDSHSVNTFIDSLYASFRYDQNEIFNIDEDLEILEILENMQSHLPPKKWGDVIRKSVKKTKVKERTKAINQLNALLPKNQEEK